MNKVGVIGGSRFATLKNLSLTHSTSVKTPYGDPSAPLSYGILGDQEVVYLPRRGSGEALLDPHEVNYRANIWALRDAGVQTVIATSAVATLISDFSPGDVIIPDQLIDYTYGRENTFLGEDVSVSHISFAYPYSGSLRQIAIKKAKALQYPIANKATYGIAQGPRLETIAEAIKLAQDGCHLVGMTGMPEASLARELGLEYLCIALVVRRAAGLEGNEKNDEVRLDSRENWVEDLIEAIILEPV